MKGIIQYRVLITALLTVLVFGSCRRESNTISIIPPSTPVLTRKVIGFGVIIAPYAQVLAEPSLNALSLGYLRKNSIVEVLERRSVNNNGAVEPWVFVVGTYRGWLREDENLVQVYDNEAQAKTAAGVHDS